MKNPVLIKARQEAYNKGFTNGFEQGRDNACLLFATKFDGLDKVPGIGPKLMERIVNHFGREYFEEVKK